jgi:hypothetical protein
MQSIGPQHYTGNIPKSLEEAKIHAYYIHWKKQQKGRWTLLQKNNTWSLVTSREGAKLIDCNWIFQLKMNETANVSRYRASFIAKRFM